VGVFVGEMAQADLAQELLGALSPLLTTDPFSIKPNATLSIVDNQG
jgi:hypothetical protein